MRGFVGTHRAESRLIRVRSAVWSHAGLVGAATVMTALAYSILLLHRHAMFGTQIFDLGIFDQGVWLLSRFKEPFVTFRGLNLFADHSSWILFLITPLYWIWSDVRVLLLLTVLAVTAGGPLVYAIARTEGIRKPLATALAVAYLLHPAAAWNMWDAFHPEVLAIPLLLAAYLFASRKSMKLAAVALLLTLLVKEDAALVVVPFALYLGWRFKAWRMSGVVMTLAVLLFIFNFEYVLPHFSPTGTLIYTSRYGDFGNGLPEIVWNVVTSPGEVISILATPTKLIYLSAMILPMFLALLAPELLVVAAPITLANLLSQHGYQSQIKYHYTVYLLAIVALAAIRGASRIDREPLTRFAIPAVLIAGIVGVVAAGPLPGTPRGEWGGTTGDPAAINEALAMIPDDAPLSADWFIGPHVGHRDVVYMYSNPFVRDYWSVDSVAGPPIDGAEWVVMRANTPGEYGEKTEQALEIIKADPSWEQVIANDAVLLYHRTD